MNEKLTLIIVSFNSSDSILLNQKELLLSKKHPAIILDNASPDDSGAILRTQLPMVDVITLPENWGYGRAANIGLRQVKTPYALLLNPDLEVTSEQIDKLLQHVKHGPESTAIWGPATKKNDFVNCAPRETTRIHGSAMLFDVEKIKKVGLFDENFFLFSEETDLCERTIRAGYTLQICPDVFFNHFGGQSSAPSKQVDYMKWWHFGWSQCYRMTKHRQCTIWKNPQRKYITYTLHSILATSSRQRSKWRAKAAGTLAFMRGETAFDKKGVPQQSIFQKKASSSAPLDL